MGKQAAGVCLRGPGVMLGSPGRGHLAPPMDSRQGVAGHHLASNPQMGSKARSVRGKKTATGWIFQPCMTWSLRPAPPRATPQHECPGDTRPRGQCITTVGKEVPVFPALVRLSRRGSTHTMVASEIALWERLMGKTPGKATDSLIHEKGSVTLLLPLGRKAHVHDPTRAED